MPKVNWEASHLTNSLPDPLFYGKRKMWEADNITHILMKQCDLCYLLWRCLLELPELPSALFKLRRESQLWLSSCSFLSQCLLVPFTRINVFLNSTETSYKPKDKESSRRREERISRCCSCSRTWDMNCHKLCPTKATAFQILRVCACTTAKNRVMLKNLKNKQVVTFFCCYYSTQFSLMNVILTKIQQEGRWRNVIST